jgi:CRISPR-associated endonuclease/helicase Cas3
MPFPAFFTQATGTAPFPYQHHLAESPTLLPQLIHIPTGAGKTAAVILAWLWRRRFADASIRQATPRRLIYCLPMRVLVEQTRDAVVRWLDHLGLLAGAVNLKDGTVSSYQADSADALRVAGWAKAHGDTGPRLAVHVLMGGEAADDWDLYPERDAILIGTQDMLLSRALNRGYGMSRYRWPVPFGLLHTDALWVLDEVQLMGAGLATTAQLEGLRHALGTLGPVRSLWMSATLQPDWLATVDFGETLHTLTPFMLGPEARRTPGLQRRLEARKRLRPTPVTAATRADAIAAWVLEVHRPGTLMLVILNTVERARALLMALTQRGGQGTSRRARRTNPRGHAPAGLPTPEFVLLHARFRPPDRAAQFQQPLSPLSDAGRIAIATQVVEAGVDLSATTLVTELAPWASLVQRFGRCNRFGESSEATVYWMDVPTGGRQRLAPPYAEVELASARAVLTTLGDVGVQALPPAVAMPYEPAHVLRRKDLLELFDTTPDLAGFDLDVSRFIREADDLDVQVFWRDVAPGTAPDPDQPSGAAPRREELCPVPVMQARAFAMTRRVFRWDVLAGYWVRAVSRLILPGQVLLIPADQGGYTPRTGWDVDSPTSVLPVPAPSGGAIDANDDDWPSRSPWQRIAEHADEVVAEVRRMVGALTLPEVLGEALEVAARWHDRGKAHPIFQEAIYDDASGVRARPDAWRGCREVAKAPGPCWGRYGRRYFRHELATGLAMLQAGLPDLAVYLATAHHGKVRLSIRALPEEARPPDPLRRVARGVWDDDPLPATELGGGVVAPAVTLRLDPMEVGRDPSGQPSWGERMLRLLQSLGPFRLACVEAILRAADMRVSQAQARRGGQADG